MNFESIFIIALLILAAYGMHREKVKRLERTIDALIGEKKALTDEVNKHRMAVRRKRLQQETEKLKPYSDVLLARLRDLHPTYSFILEVREDGESPEPDTLYLSIKDNTGVKVEYDEFISIRKQAYEIAERFPVEIYIADGDA